MLSFISDAHAADAQTTTGITEAPAVPYELSAEKMMMDNLLVLGLLFFIFYYMLIRPQQKRVKMHKEMLKGLQKGSKVMTNGGLYGSISKFEGDDIVVLEVAPNVKIRVAKSAISDTVDNATVIGETANDN